jgi:hypothetical protein
MHRVFVVIIGLAVLFFPSVCSAEWVLKVVGPSLRVTAINDRGDAAGAAMVADGAGSYPFIWTAKQGLRLLEQFPGGRATDINNKGAVVGILPGGGSEMDLGFLWSAAEGAVHLGTFLPDSINDDGLIGGSCSDWVTTIPQACLWADGVITPIALPTPSGSCCSMGIWVNEHGMTAGCALPVACDPFLRTRRGELVLLDVPSDARVVEVHALNNRGETAGVAFSHDPYASPKMLLWNAEGALTYTTDASLQLFGMNDKRQLVGITGECSATFCIDRATVWTRRDGTVVLPDLGEGGQALAINRRGEVAGVVYVNGVQYGAIWWYEQSGRMK